MGGWKCSAREHCANYLERGHHPVERLCGANPEPDYVRNGREVSLTDHSQAPLNPVATIPALQGGGFTQVATAHDIAGS